MKIVKLFVLAALALAAAQSSRAAIGPSCALFCAQIHCIPEDVCGSFVNGAGQTVCGCHARP
jgi:hypothetical protein